MADTILSEKTLVPIGVIVTLGASIIGGIFWVSSESSTMYAQVRNNTHGIIEVKQTQKEVRDEIRSDILRLEDKIDILLQRK